MRVKLYATLRKAAQRKEVEITPSETTARGLLKRLIDLYDAEFEGLLTNEGRELAKGVIFLVNGRNILHLQGLETPLKEEDAIELFPPVAGG
ncbi:MAG TPA: MoaD/ThiS family protein [Synergistaceae bacterium]|nr:MoaD/ThiS family protein [Synergistaceae bacterium]